MGVLLMCLAVLVAAAWWLLGQQETDGEVVNIAGRQRMLSQKMTKEALLLGQGLGDAAQLRQQLEATSRLFQQSLQGLRDGDRRMNLPPTHDPEVLAQLERVAAQWLPMQAALAVLGASQPGAGEFQGALQTLIQGNLELLKGMNQATEMYAALAAAKVRALKTVMLAGLALGMAVFSFTWWLVRTRMIRPLGRVVEDVGLLSQGDLRPYAHQGLAQDEIGDVARSLGALRGSLNASVGLIRDDAAALAESAGHISSGNQDLNERTQQQAAAIEQTAAAVEELTASVRNSAQGVRQADELAKAAAQQARQGGQVVGRTAQAMRQVRDSSQKISDIIGLVNEIAFQTNLLALNAAVEAARAGEAGRGFAVVASEVRNLAGRASAAAKQIQGLIADSAAQVAQGGQLMSESAQLLEEIIAKVQQLAQTVGAIWAATQEQASGIEEVNKAVIQMDQAVQQNAALVEETAAAAQSLSELAAQLQARVEGFSL
ncbi:MAG: type IV pili methyl-accepting chemotaxis transducer N-terminal domain-containing protein [Desulfarculus sp.]|nr:type IV pili methyl-accepting chemotaxis transducer N-terminal domain-containing protein [Desulfarculus sp.]